jgi:acyl transferase domain-containing protein/NAD(P)H-dependent flavin oxidoreductase YrpB (nitropropane dioxygenase family)/NAD(P)-dependent dehydrogenase (short-subunit alcohol dehydrogenase family)
MRKLEVIAVTPATWVDPTLAIAACRAGHRGILDLEVPAGPKVASGALERLARHARAPYGVKLGPSSGMIVDSLITAPPAGLCYVLFAGGTHADLERWVDAFRHNNIDIFLEAIDTVEAQRAADLGARGVVLKGQEAGGRVGTETAFVLLQRWLAVRTCETLVWVHGGVGLNTAAACLATGAAGVVLDGQLLLARESPLDEETRQRLTAFDGSETVCVGERLGEAYRFYSRPAMSPIEELSSEEERIFHSALALAEKKEAWRQTVKTLQRDQALWPLGQDACFARPLAERFVTAAGIIDAVVERAKRQVAAARRLQPLAPGALLASRHRTRFPIVQGPMTRVSDTAAFAGAVASAGALPFLALALLRQAETEKLLRETKALVGDKAWGVGILGFVPPEIRREQIEAIRACPPPFALIAGGRPDQARELEKEGIATYLHVPSPGLLRLFLKDGARRFVFEGRECGGHVGPRTSFVLWETMCEVLLEHLGPAGRGDDLHVIFAGGIHDARSAAMVSALAAGLAERGVAVGVLVGTAYLFTAEAVASGAIVHRFQSEALACQETVLLQTGPGHAIRCIKTPYFDVFEQEKLRLRKEGKSHEEIVKALEWMNIGRLRVASKGVDRPREESVERGALSASGLVSVPEEDQYERGMYMIGQVACMHDHIVSMAELHEDISAGGTRLVEESGAENLRSLEDLGSSSKPCDIAVIGMDCYYPKGSGVAAYWENILNKVNAVGEVPATHWDWRLYYDPDPRAPDKIISKWGGFLDDIPFDPLTYGITPNSLHSIEPLQLFLLEAVRQALGDAGYAQRPFKRDRTCAILGIGGGGSPVAVAYGFRTCLPLLDTVKDLDISSAEVLKKAEPMLPSWTEDSFPGILLNVAVGRVANRFDFGGANYAIDAACGASLAAVQACIRELESGTSDLAVAMGADTVQTPYAYMAFSKTHALSPRGRCQPFDAAADGIVLSEGIAAVVLKRLADAERDGDKIYAVIRGMGASSDGRDKGLTAPRAEGQLRALRRAYAKAGFSPARVGLIEAHGTGTVVGDQTEAQALAKVFSDAGAAPQSCAIGSVKSMIGHSKCAAGIAGLIKTSLALYHKVLPPTLVEKPNPRGNFEEGPLYLNTEPRPWVHGGSEPRCAGVSAFGFGGTNFHLALEEYTGEYVASAPPAAKHWPTELLLWRRADQQSLAEAVRQCHQALVQGAQPQLADLALSVWKTNPVGPISKRPALAIIASSVADLKDKLAVTLDAFQAGKERLHDPRGIYYAANVAAEFGKVAFLFPGQGSQYPNMLALAAMIFPEVRTAFDRSERSLAGCLEKPLGRYVFPPSTFTPERELEARQALTRTEIAQPAVGAAGLGMFHLLTKFGIKPDFLAGHSYGEYVALCAAGALSEEDLATLSHRRGKLIVEATVAAPGSMAAFDASFEQVQPLLAGLESITVANINAPNQTVVSGTEAALEAALTRAREQGLRAQKIPVARAFHSPLVARAQTPLAALLAGYSVASPSLPVYSNTTASAYPSEPGAIKALLARHLVAPVLFGPEIAAMYDAGARIFIEVGPQGVLTGLVGQILAGKAHVAVASDLKGRPGLVQVQHLLGQLLVQGLPVCLERLYAGRDLTLLDLADLKQQTGRPKLPPSTWIINSVRARPLNAPEPVLLGQARHEERATRDGGQRTQSNGEDLSRQRSPEPAAQRPATATTHLPTAGQNGVPQSISFETSAGSADETAQVMLRFQDLMARFLDTQKSIMTSYLQGSGSTLPSPADAAIQDGRQPAQASPARQSPQPEPANGQVVAAPTGSADSSQTSSNGTAPSQLAMDRAWLTAQLLELVSQRTGYPKEMLGLDQDLEADLGIDSIKRVEILGGLAEAMGGSSNGTVSSLEMEKLTTLKSLRGILDYLDNAMAQDKNPHAPLANGDKVDPVTNGHVKKEKKSLEVQRALVRLVDAPPPAHPALMLPRGTILFTDDGRGIAREMAARLADFGQKCVLLRHDCQDAHASPFAPDGSRWCADLTEPRAVENLLKRLRDEEGPLAGLIHVLPLAQPPADETPIARAQREVKSLYLLARGLGEDLRRAGDRGGAVVLAVTGLGGSLGFGNDLLPESYFPGHGGVAGFSKCLALEWPEVLVRAVDVDGGQQPTELAECLLAEFGNSDSPVEVGYAGRRRVTWEPYPAPIQRDAAAAPILDNRATVLITGGARGITAAVAVELARRYQPRLVIVGRSPVPEHAESTETAALTTAAEIKAALIARRQREGRPPSAAAVEAAYQRLLHDREMRANLARIQQAGASVHYRQVDVRDPEAMSELLADIDRRFGGLDGVIHGAGVIEDKLIKDKTPESFDRVFGTKAASAMILSQQLKPERLKFCVFFASVASRYGNKGQADYAAANETLSKLAWELDRRWPGRVFSVAWGPWARIGMVADLEKHLTQRGLKLISPEEGPAFLIDELQFGRKGESEVIIAGGAEELARPAASDEGRGARGEQDAANAESLCAAQPARSSQ